MNRHLRLFAYALAGAALLLAALAGPAAWGAASASVLAQTVPSPTPTLRPVTPTEPPPPTRAPSATPIPGATEAPSSGDASGPSAACAGLATLGLVADQAAVAPGMTVVFTATLTNTSPQALNSLVLEDVLSAGLEPGRVIAGGGTWQARTLRSTLPTLAAGARLVVVYSATVSVPSGPVITARASATVAGCPAKTATVTLALPPSELPRTGGGLD